MGIEIPDELAWVAKYILGAGDWPEGDETAMRRVADGWTAMASTLDTVDDNAALALNAALTALSEGETHTAITTFRDKLLSGDEATFAAVRKWCEKQAELLEDGANDIEHTKLVIIATMIIAAVEIGAAIATSWTGVGAVAGVAARVAAQVAVRVAIKQLIARMLTRGAAKAAARLALRGAAFEALEEGGTDLGARLIQVAKGDRSADKFGWTDLGLATFGGAVGGAAGGLLGGGTGALGDVASSTAGKLAGKVVGGTVTELGADLSAQVATAGVGAAFLGREFELDVGVDTFTSAGAGGVQSALESSSHGGNSTAPTVPDVGTDVPGATTPAGTDTPSGDQSPNGSGNNTPNAPTSPNSGDTGGSTNPASTAPTGDGATPQGENTQAPGESAPTNPNDNGATPPAGDSAPSNPNSNGSTGTPDAGETSPSSNGSPSAGDPTPSSPNDNGSNPTPPTGDTTPSNPGSDTPTGTPQTGDSPSTPNSSAPAETPSTGDTSPSDNPANTSPTGETTPNPTGLSLHLPNQDSSPQPNAPTDNSPNTTTGQQNPTPSDNGQSNTTPANPQPTPAPTAPTAPTTTPDSTTQQPTTSPPAATTTQESTPQQSPTSTPAATTTSPTPTTTPTNNPTHSDTTRPSSTDTSTATATTTTAPPTQTANATTTPTTSTPPPTATPTSTPAPPINQTPTSAPSSVRPATSAPAATGSPNIPHSASSTTPSPAGPSSTPATTPNQASAPATIPPSSSPPQQQPLGTSPTAPNSPNTHQLFGPNPTPTSSPNTPNTTNQPPRNQARELRESLRNLPSQDGRTTAVDANRSPFVQRPPAYRIRRFHLGGNQWVAVATIRAHIPDAHSMSPSELRQAVESIQATVDATFNNGSRLLSGDQFLVDVEFTTDPATADTTLAPDQPSSTANALRDHMGLFPAAPGQTLSPNDLREISNDIARANTPARFSDPADSRVIDHRELADVEDPAHQARVEDSLRAGNSFIQGADPRTHPYGQLTNDGGRTVPGRGNNCLDCSLSALSSFYGLPRVSAPRWPDQLPNGQPDNVSGEWNGRNRAAACLGANWASYSGMPIPDQYQALHNYIAGLGPGSAAMVGTRWHARDQNGNKLYNNDGSPVFRGGHATVIVFPPGATGPVWWDPQSGQTFDAPPAYLTNDSAALECIPIDANGGSPHGGTSTHQGTGQTFAGPSVRSEPGVQHPGGQTRLDMSADAVAGGGRPAGNGLGELRDQQTYGGDHGALEHGDAGDRGGIRRGDGSGPTAPGLPGVSETAPNSPDTQVRGPEHDRVPSTPDLLGEPGRSGDNPGSRDHQESDPSPADRPSVSGRDVVGVRTEPEHGDMARGGDDRAVGDRPSDSTAPTSQSSVNQAQTSPPAPTNTPPSTPGTSPVPADSTTPASHQSSTPTQSTPTPQQVDNANQARTARENLRSQHPDGGVRPVTNPQGGREGSVESAAQRHVADNGDIRGVGITSVPDTNPSTSSPTTSTPPSTPPSAPAGPSSLPAPPPSPDTTPTPQSPSTSLTPESTAPSPAGGSPYIEAGGARRPRNAYDTEAQDAWANNAYDHIRSTDADLDGMVAGLADVPRHDGSVGFGRAELERIKNHLFREEHPLSITDDDGKDIGIEYRRYDAYADIAEAWMRMSLGRATPDDIVLLEHELAEAQYYESHPGAPYQEAHQFANLSFNWEAMQHSHTGENIDEWSSVYGNVSGVPAGVGDRPGSDVPVRRGGSQSQSVPDNQQGGLLGEGRGREGGRDGSENSRHRDDSSPSGRSLDQGGQLPSLNNPPPRQSGGHNSAGNQPPNSPPNAAGPSPDSAPPQRPAVPAAADSTAVTPVQQGPIAAPPRTQQTAVPQPADRRSHEVHRADIAASIEDPSPPRTPPTSDSNNPSSAPRSPQDLENAARSRSARERIRASATTGNGSTQIRNQNSGRSFQVRRVPDFFGQPLTLLRIAVHFSGSASLNPHTIRELSERAQLATDLAFNGGHQFINGEWVMVDLVPVDNPADADMQVRVDDSGAPGTTHPDADIPAITSRLREQLGLEPTTDTLSASDLRQVSSDIDRAAFAASTAPPWQANSFVSNTDFATNSRSAPPVASLPNNSGRPPHRPDFRAPESNTPTRPNTPPAPSFTSPTSAPFSTAAPHSESQPPRDYQSWGAPNPNHRPSRSSGPRPSWRRLLGLPSRAPAVNTPASAPSRNTPVPPPHRPSALPTTTPAVNTPAPAPSRNTPAPTPHRPPAIPTTPDNSRQERAEDEFGATAYRAGPPFQTQDMHHQYVGEHLPGNTVWETPPSNVEYLDEQARRPFRIEIRDGILYNSNGQRFDTTVGRSSWGISGRAIFVMDQNGNLYAALEHAPGRFNHSSFLAGSPVAAAGELVVINGVIQTLSDSSGHYRPERGHTLQAIDHIRRLGIQLTTDQIRLEASRH
ncbi:toxin glutamine deamidase domain-containing protein [Nocardia sp. NPDC058519]|uniref:toxin glutamine deamidase domain-containing protein n=1 Tax=Nocardia sp. NPDC058519 TaxID=3346535 RepID=UPI0036491DB1